MSIRRMISQIAFTATMIWTFTTIAQTLPAGYQEYVVLGRDSQVYDFLSHVASAENDDLTATAMESVVTLTATLDQQTVIYDHWEDGFEADPMNPQQSSTQVFTLSRGQVLSLESNGAGPGINDVIPMPRNPTDIRYDGGDKVLSIGGPVDLAHNMWPEGNTWIGGAWEVYAKQALAGFLTYRIPVGVDSYNGNNGSFAPFKYVDLQITAFDDNTRVVVNNGTDRVVVTLDRGQTYFTGGTTGTGRIDETDAASIEVRENTLVSATSEVQVGILSGSDGSYQTRFFNAIPLKAYGRDYIVPVLGANNARVNIYLFNPNNTQATATVYDANGSNSFTIPATSATSLLDETGSLLANGSGARITSDLLIWGVVAYDYTTTNRDWGFSLVPTRYLKNEYFVSWSPVNRLVDPAQGGSPVWISPTRDGTTVWIDRDGDGTFDDMDTDGDGTADPGPYSLDVLDVLRIYDQVDGDNTGTHIVADAPVAVIYGQDEATAPAADPSLDLGYTVLPLTQDFLDPILAISASPSVTSIPSSGGDIQVTVTIDSANYDGITEINSWLTVADDASYVPGSAMVTLPGSAAVQMDPTDSVTGTQRTLDWNLGASLDAHEQISVSLTLRWEGTDPDGFYTVSAGADGRFLDIQLHPVDSFDLTKTFLKLEKSADQSSVSVGSVLTYTITATNTSSAPIDVISGLVLADPLHEGLDFVSADNGGLFDGQTRQVTWNLGNLLPGQAVTVHCQVLVTTLPEGTILDNTAMAFTNNLPLVRSNTVMTQLELPELVLTKTATPFSVGRGDIITYTISIENTSSLDASGVLVTDSIPVDTSYVSNSMTLDTGSGPVAQTDAQDGDLCDYDISAASAVSIVLGALPAGASYSFTFQVQVDNSALDGSSIVNMATIESDTTLPRLSNVMVTDVGNDDPDGDGLSNQTEASLGTDPDDADTDDDGLSDGDEDSNHNGSIGPNETNPLDPDSDGDGLQDGAEMGETSGVADPDGSGPLGGTDPGVFIPDTDPGSTTDPLDNDTDDDNLLDGQEDANHNGFVDVDETDPNMPDTDGDNFNDDIDTCPLTPNPLQDLDLDPDNCGTCGNSCSDGLYCDGDEVCSGGNCGAGQAVLCDDSIGCTTDTCDEQNDICNNLADDSACNDGLFCNGVETCDAATGCQQGTDPCPGQLCDEAGSRCVDCLSDADCDDSVACTLDVCDPSSGTCSNTVDDSACDDGSFCNGQETCDALAGCQQGTQPCSGQQLCDEAGSRCVNCLSDADCDDSVTCSSDVCDPATGTCSNTPDDSACDDSDVCTLDQCDALAGCSNLFQDADSDGTCDALDPCPDDPNDECICSDRDSDGICDDFDICPDDPTNTCGTCPDADSDGICDVNDPCPDDPTNTCDPCTDTDSDGICDDVDPCPDDPTNTCSVCVDTSDPDNDGNPTCTDPCPNDPTDSCVPCTDSDSDGICDDFDICPDDPTNTCGDCTDSDGDGTCDAVDPCPQDPEDQCVPCTDEDSDGICDDVDPCPGDASNTCGACVDTSDPDNDGNPTCTDPCPNDPTDSCVPCTDSDSDGICDDFDICPDDPTNTCGDCTDSDGDGTCDATDPCPNDSEDRCVPCMDEDADNLCDDQDPCPGDPSNTCGACVDQSDPDHDGVPNCADPCPNDPTDSCVPCPDADLDGICDAYDPCPDDANNSCQECKDSDSDGVCDFEDPCPDDPDLECTCTDSDSDGLCDDTDPCPDDATNSCDGCRDTSDPDNDGKPTCIDPCPNDAADLCVGCTDTDSDGTCDNVDPCPDDPKDQCTIWQDGRLTGGGCACSSTNSKSGMGWLMLSLLGMALLKRRKVNQ